MKRLLLAPLLLFLLTGCVNPSEISEILDKKNVIKLKCITKYISIEDSPYKLLETRKWQTYLVTVNTKKKEGFYTHENSNGYKLKENQTISPNLTKEKISFEDLFVTTSIKVEDLFSINRVNGEIIKFRKYNYGPNQKTKGKCYLVDDIETLF
tara:strand:+ start:219 stop:677 length:459 start_codon:yes stop_codon:yes gene_type:complete